MKKTLPLMAALCLSAAVPVHAQTQSPPTTVPPGTTSPSNPSATPSPMSPSTPPAVTTPSAPSPSVGSAASSSTGAVTLTDAEAKDWIDRVIYSSDGANLGEVAAFARDGSGRVTELHADLGGLMGVGETRVRIMPSQFRLENDRVTLNLTKEQTKQLPVIDKVQSSVK